MPFADCEYFLKYFIQIHQSNIFFLQKCLMDNTQHTHRERREAKSQRPLIGSHMMRERERENVLLCFLQTTIHPCGGVPPREEETQPLFDLP